MPDEPADATDLDARHAAVYASPKLPRFAHWQVTARLHAGRNPLSERDVADLAALGISHVLDLREELEWTGSFFGLEAIEALPCHGIERRNVPIPDYTPPSAAALAATTAWIDEVLALPRARLYVHCRAGIQRTAAVLLAWRLSTRPGTPATALADLRQYGWPGDPLPNQQAAVERWLAEQQGAHPGT